MTTEQLTKPVINDLLRKADACKDTVVVEDCHEALQGCQFAKRRVARCINDLATFAREQS